MVDIGHFNTDDHDTTDSYELVAQDWYSMIVEDSEIKEAKSGNKYLSLKWRLSEGQSYGGRVLYTSLNLWHANPDTQKYAANDLAKISKAMGLSQVGNTEQLHAIEIECFVKVKEPTEKDKANGYDQPKNEIKRWRKKGSGDAKPANTPPSGGQGQAPANGGGPAWNRPRT